MKIAKSALLASALIAWPAAAQTHAGHGPQSPPVMDQSQMDHSAAGHAPDGSPAPFSEGSGTARLPGNSGAMRGMHIMAGDWMVMLHGSLSAQFTDHSGPRGDDQFYVTSMAMLGGSRATDWGRIQLKSMLSLEPLMDARGYPNLFASGETANGLPLVDRQHPHDLFMELSARVDVDVSEDSSVFLYGGPVGEPALGPSAFMHRPSAALNPEPPITHHWFDSTHITYGVVTAGYSAPLFQLEASAFRGREPDEDRWNIEAPRFDSWTVRGTLTPSPAWTLQASYGELQEPEALHPGEDERRLTASAQYDNGRGFSALLAFSSKTHVASGTPADDALIAWIAEANWDIDPRNTLFARYENVANDELFADHAHPLHDQRFRVSKVQIGYARRIPLGPFELALGASGSLYGKPAALDPYYGEDPAGYTLFARLSLVK